MNIAMPSIHQYRNLRLLQEMLGSTYTAGLYFDHLESHFRHGRGNKGDPITFDLVEYLAQICWVVGFGLTNKNVKYEPATSISMTLVAGFGTEFISFASSIQQEQININMNNNAFFTPGEFRYKPDFTKMGVASQFRDLSGTISAYIEKMKEDDVEQFEQHFKDNVQIVRRPKLATRNNLAADPLHQYISTIDTSLFSGKNIMKEHLSFFIDTEKRLTSLSLHYRMRGFRVVSRHNQYGPNPRVIEIF